MVQKTRYLKKKLQNSVIFIDISEYLMCNLSVKIDCNFMVKQGRTYALETNGHPRGRVMQIPAPAQPNEVTKQATTNARIQ